MLLWADFSPQAGGAALKSFLACGIRRALWHRWCGRVMGNPEERLRIGLDKGANIEGPLPGTGFRIPAAMPTSRDLSGFMQERGASGLPTNRD